MMIMMTYNDDDDATTTDGDDDQNVETVTLVLVSTIAPLDSSALTTPTCPLLAASWRHTAPSLFGM